MLREIVLRYGAINCNIVHLEYTLIIMMRSFYTVSLYVRRKAIHCKGILLWYCIAWFQGYVYEVFERLRVVLTSRPCQSRTSLPLLLAYSVELENSHLVAWITLRRGN